mgnify:CR=1 FL=1
MLKIGVITMALMSFLNANWFTDFFDDTPTPAIYIPIDLTKPSKIETKVRIKEKTAYSTFLDFMIDKNALNNIDMYRRDVPKIRKFLGFNSYLPYDGSQLRFYTIERVKREMSVGKFNINIDNNYNLDGTTVPIKMTIYRLGENDTRTLFLEKVYQTKGSNGGGRKYTTREFAYLLLEKGTYLFIVENLKGFPELQGREVLFSVRHTHTK